MSLCDQKISVDRFSIPEIRQEIPLSQLVLVPEGEPKLTTYHVINYLKLKIKIVSKHFISIKRAFRQVYIYGSQGPRTKIEFFQNIPAGKFN